MQEKCATDRCQNWSCKKMMRYSHIRQWEAMGKETNDFPYRDMSPNCKDIIAKDENYIDSSKELFARIERFKEKYCND